MQFGLFSKKQQKKKFEIINSIQKQRKNQLENEATAIRRLTLSSVRTISPDSYAHGSFEKNK